MRKPPYESEATPQGKQSLVPGVSPITPRSRLQALIDAPLFPKRIQKPCDIALFDEAARNQLDLFIPMRMKEPGS